MGLGAEGGEEGGDAVYDAEEVGIHYLHILKMIRQSWLIVLVHWIIQMVLGAYVLYGSIQHPPTHS